MSTSNAFLDSISTIKFPRLQYPGQLRSIAWMATISAAVFLTSTIAESNPASPPPATREAATVAATEPTTASATTDERRTFVSDGSPVVLESLGIQIAPPQGWEVSTRTGLLSVVMSEVLPVEAKPDYSKPIFKRNITVATTHKATPIDEARAMELRDELTRTFSADASVKDFQVVEHKFFNYRGTNDGLLIYSSLMLGEFRMMQAHVLVSGSEKQFLLTYTDLADSFVAGGVKFEQAWNSMASINVTGVAPDRHADLIRYGAISGGILLFMALLIILGRRAAARRRARKLLATESDDFEFGNGSSSAIATIAGDWTFSSHSSLEDDSSFDHAVSQAKAAFTTDASRPVRSRAQAKTSHHGSWAQSFS